MLGISCVAEQLLASRERVGPMKLVEFSYGYCCFQKYSLFVTRIARNAQMHCVWGGDAVFNVKAGGTYSDHSAPNGEVLRKAR
jgi:hypothetical protein